MRELHIYPTSRAIRAAKEELRASDGFVPDMMRIDEFEARMFIVPQRRMVDTLQRRLFLREAAAFDAFKTFGVSRTMPRFFAHSDAFFRFFEELAGEEVGIETLAQADVYAEYADHLGVLKTLRDRYDALLQARGFTDKAFIWRDGRLNLAFLSRYQALHVHLEGYLTRAEMRLFEAVAKHVPVLVTVRITRFLRKMRERFEALGVRLPKEEGDVTIDLAQRKAVAFVPLASQSDIEVIGVHERAEQAAAVMAAVAEFVDAGVAPEKIAVVLPDESFASLLAQFDRHRNLNFAMGFAYTRYGGYKALRRFDEALKRNDTQALETMWRNAEQEAAWRDDVSVEVSSFFALLCGIGEESRQDAAEAVAAEKEAFEALFRTERFRLRTWLFLWLERLQTLRIDDTRGGRITVLGVLETRAMAFDAIIIPDFNEGKVPSLPSKERFLNSTVRAFAGLPTRSDRENLQKYYYDNILRRCQKAIVMYRLGDAHLPSRFLYELGLDAGKHVDVPRRLLYDIALRLKPAVPQVPFDASRVLWSASRLAVWVQCPRRYYYRYIKGLEAPQEERFIEGSYIHDVLYRLFDEEVSSAEAMRRRLVTVLEACHPGKGTRVRYDVGLYAARLETFVEAQAQHFAQGWRIVAREVSIEKEIEGLRFTGRIDRIDEREGAKILIDYKTGKLPSPTKNTTLEEVSDFQMPLYEMLFDNEAKGLYCHVFEGGWQEPKYMALQRDALMMRIETLRQTDTLVATQTEDLKRCVYCEFRLLCERGEFLNA